MHIHDPRLKFGRGLIEHWLQIRGGDLVPFAKDIDARELLGFRRHLAIADVMQPRRVVFELAGAAVQSRFGQPIRHVDWVKLVPPALGNTGKRARELVQRVPCGYYHKFTAVLDEMHIIAETFVLPLRYRSPNVPDEVIGITRELGEDGRAAPPGWLAPSSHIARFFHEFVDIGAGVSPPQEHRP